MCQDRSINCNKYTTLMGDVDLMGECMHIWAQGVHGKSLASQHFLWTCNCDLKTSMLKIILNTKINAKKKKTILHTTSMCVLHILLYTETYA